MPCQWLKYRPKSFSENMAAAGLSMRDDMTIAQIRECDSMLAEQSREPIIMCGSAPIIPVCSCGYVADYLCDYPVGDGKTCDLNLCQSCALEIGDDKHLCELHWYEWTGKAKVERINPVGPSLVK